MNKTILITGANGNLGVAAVQAMLEEGFRVVGTGHVSREQAGLDEHENLEYFSTDLTDEQQAAAAVSGILNRYGSLDAALLLVGGFAMGGIDVTGGKEIRQMFSLNFETAYHVVRPIYQHMLERKYGRIVFIGARPALQPAIGKAMIAYSLSKSLLFRLADLLNEDAKGTNVVSSVVIPSTIDTPQNRAAMPEADFSKWVKAEQIAGVMKMICTDTGNPLREAVYKVYGDA